MTTVLLIRDDLRLDDHPALIEAAGADEMVPIYCDHDAVTPWGGAAKWWTAQALSSLDDALREKTENRNAGLWALADATGERIADAARALGADRVVWSAGRTPGMIEHDKAIAKALKERSIERSVHAPNLLFPLGIADKDNGEPRKVFTAFYKHATKQMDPDEPVGPPASIPSLGTTHENLRGAGLVPHDELSFAPTGDWTKKLAARWTPTIDAGHERARAFFEDDLGDYKDARNDLEPVGSSMLSPWIRSGQVSVRRLWHRSREVSRGKGSEHFRSELGWREFSNHMLIAFPSATREPVQTKFEDFPWRDDDEAFDAWRTGTTGYPVSDAAMRQLWHTGWMPNRARMIVASLLTKHLLVPWQRGADWFMDTLVDADPGNNYLGWQWTAGCGFDAAPYFRIFNPITQGEKFDPSGEYVRTWVPELAPREGKKIHEPVDAELSEELGYPEAMVDHAQARERALSAFDAVKGS